MLMRSTTDMAMLGKRQVLRRNFNFLTMLAFASTCIASWEGILTYLGFVLTDGGTALLFWYLLSQPRLCPCRLLIASLLGLAGASLLVR